MKRTKKEFENDMPQSKYLKRGPIVKESLKHPENAVLINDFATLAAIGKTLPLDGYYVQTKDIYFVPDQLKQYQPPIGSQEQPFRGQYHGNGFRIINLTILSDRAALFDTVENATINDITLENARFIGAGPIIKVAALAIEIKGTSHVKNIKWISGGISLQYKALKEAEIAGMVHTLEKQSLLINVESNGDLIIQKPEQGSNEIKVAGIAFYNSGIIKNAIREKNTEGLSVYGVVKVNEGTIDNVKIKDVTGVTFAAGVVEYNKKTSSIEGITVSNVSAQQDAVGVVSYNEGNLKNIQIGNVTTQEGKAIGVAWRNKGHIETIEVRIVSSQQRAYGIAVVNNGTIHHMQIGNVISANDKAYALAFENGNSAKIKMASIGNAASQDRLYNQIININKGTIRFIHLKPNQNELPPLTSLLTNDKISDVFLEKQAADPGPASHKFTYVNSKNKLEYKAAFFQKKWDLLNIESPEAKWLWSTQGPKLKTATAYPIYQAYELLQIFRTFLGQFKADPGFYNIKSIPLDLMIKIAKYIQCPPLSLEHRKKIIEHALNRDTLMHPDKYQKLTFS